MYRDNSLMPKEAIRLAALGTLHQSGPMRYADLATSIRRFTGRIVGPSLDLMGTSLEMLRYEGLTEALEGTGMEDNALIRLTGTGYAVFLSLMRANIRSPSSDDLNKLVITLKLRFLHHLDPAEQHDQIDALTGLAETERARLRDLRQGYADEPGHLVAWLDHDLAQIEARLEWFASLRQTLRPQ
ncbi:MAG: hypothetical protein P4M00_07880 [Azospirillaceae bacterium]|nr:hypothetical protein [Azospirillaceae bacterium]